MVIWIIGLSAAGKTTLGLEMHKLLKESGKWVFLDGDTVRTIMGEELGYTLEDRVKNAYRMTRLCKILELQGVNVIASVLSISQENRDYNRGYFDEYKEVFIEVSMNKLMERDNKNLYKKALEKEIENIIGVDIPFERPQYSDYIFENNREGIDFTEKGIEIIRDLGLDVSQDYPYTNKNRLKYPEKYQYTQYKGTLFLEGYEKNRENIIAQIKLKMKNEEKNDEMVFEWVNNIDNNIEKEDLITSTNLLKRICQSVFKREEDDMIYKFIKKFEVSKKIYNFYIKERWIKVGDDFSNLNNYLLFDIALIYTYFCTSSKYKKMICMNAILKLNDLIISIVNENISEEQLLIVMYCLELERDIYNELKEKVL